MKYTWWVIVLILVGVVAVVGYAFSRPGAVKSLASITSSEAPWSAETLHLKERLDAISLPALSQEGNALHTHQHLDIFIHGVVTPVPAGIGVHEVYPSFISPVHTHDTSGITHVESPTVQTFTLGQFFDIWGVRFSATCIGAYCADETNTLAVYVDGTKYEGDPRQIELTQHPEIVITYGTKAEEPAPIPASYAFPSGY
jgi:hypothetical protein